MTEYLRNSFRFRRGGNRSDRSICSFRQCCCKWTGKCRARCIRLCLQ